MDEAEFLEGVRCVAAPIRDQDGEVIASIGVSAPLARFPRAREREMGERVMQVAGQVRDIIGTMEE